MILTLCTVSISGNADEIPRYTCNMSAKLSQPAPSRSSISRPPISLKASPVFFNADISCLVVLFIGLPLQLLSVVDDDNDDPTKKISLIICYNIPLKERYIRIFCLSLSSNRSYRKITAIRNTNCDI